MPLDALAYEPPAVAPLNRLLERLGFTELLLSDGASTRTEVCETPAEVAAALARLGSGPIALHAVLEDPSPLRETPGGNGAVSGAGRRVLRRLREPGLGGPGPVARGCARTEAGPRPPAGGGVLEARRHRAGRCRRGLGARLAPDAAEQLGASRCRRGRQAGARARASRRGVRARGRTEAKTWAALPAERAAELAGVRAQAAAEIWRALSPDVDAALLAEYLELADTCARMEMTGLVVDGAALDLAEQAFAGIEAELTQRIEALAGRSFNINSTKQLGAVLFAELKLPVASHTKTGWSTSTEALQKIEHAHPIVPLVIRWRLLRRLRDSWVIGLRRCIDVDGRVHSRFHVARSFSGHLVNTNPDLARVPGRTPEMEMIRRAFVAPPGCVLMSVDFNQLGLHVLAHLTRDPALVEPLSRREDMHRLTASAVLDKPIESIGPDDRQLGKIVNFATFAGQGSSALALDLGVSAQEAKDMIARFDRRYATVREFQDEQLRLARERGHIVTIAGRRWPIGGLESLDPHDRSYAERLPAARRTRARSPTSPAALCSKPTALCVAPASAPSRSTRLSTRCCSRCRRRSWRRPPGSRSRPCATPTSSRCPWPWASKRVPTGRTSSRCGWNSPPPQQQVASSGRTCGAPRHRPSRGRVSHWRSRCRRRPRTGSG